MRRAQAASPRSYAISANIHRGAYGAASTCGIASVRSTRASSRRPSQRYAHAHRISPGAIVEWSSGVSRASSSALASSASPASDCPLATRIAPRNCLIGPSSTDGEPASHSAMNSSAAGAASSHVPMKKLIRMRLPRAKRARLASPNRSASTRDSRCRRSTRRASNESSTTARLFSGPATRGEAADRPISIASSRSALPPPMSPMFALAVPMVVSA